MKIINIVVLTIFLILFIISLMLATIFRKKKITKLINSNKYFILNKRYVLRMIFSLINIALVVGVVGLAITETNVWYLIVDVVLVIAVNIILTCIIQIYTINEIFIYSDSKIYLYYRYKLLTFDYERVHFQKKGFKTLMYYKSDLVISTNMHLSSKKLKKIINK